MRLWIKAAAALALGLSAMGFTAASAEHRDRDRDYDRYDDHDRDHDHDRYDDQDRGDHRYDGQKSDGRRYSDNLYNSGRPDRCTLDHDHRYHNRNYYDYYPRDRYYNSDPSFSISLNFGSGYYDRSGSYYRRPYYDQRGYRDYGRVVNREVIRLRGYRAEAVLVEEVYDGRRGYDLVCTVSARGPDAHHVSYGQLRSIAARYCSHRAEIRVYA